MSAIKRRTLQCRKYISAKGLYTTADQFNISPASALSGLSPPWQPLLLPLISFHTYITNICNVLIRETASVPWTRTMCWAQDGCLHTSVHLILQQFGGGDAISNSTPKKGAAQRETGTCSQSHKTGKKQMRQDLPQGSPWHPSFITSAHHKYLTGSIMKIFRF